jgi:hypothetical protein
MLLCNYELHESKCEQDFLQVKKVVLVNHSKMLSFTHQKRIWYLSCLVQDYLLERLERVVLLQEIEVLKIEKPKSVFVIMNVLCIVDILREILSVLECAFSKSFWDLHKEEEGLDWCLPEIFLMNKEIQRLPLFFLLKKLWIFCKEKLNRGGEMLNVECRMQNSEWKILEFFIFWNMAEEWSCLQIVALPRKTIKFSLRFRGIFSLQQLSKTV